MSRWSYEEGAGILPAPDFERTESPLYPGHWLTIAGMSTRTNPSPRGAIAAPIASSIKSASFIREMFERGRVMKAQHGEQNVFDFSLGNPDAAPPPRFFETLRAVAAESGPASHRYMPNAGLPETRAAVAAFLTREYGVAFDADHTLMTCGAAAAMNAILRAICDPGDEVIVLAPYFPEYRFYVEQAGGRLVIAQMTADFQPDLAAIEAAITPRTRAVIVNSPGNPTGVVFSGSACLGLAKLLAAADEPGRPIYLICDDPYRRIIYEGGKPATPLSNYPRSILASSYSKDLSIPGERAGYAALPASLPERGQIMAALTMLNRTLGYVNMPALMQRVLARCADACCDLSAYKTNRDILCDGLRRAGYDFVKPTGALYVFPRTPIDDDRAFIDILAEQRILAVPGSGFGRPGHMRLCYCMPRELLERSLAGFETARKLAQR